MTDEQATPDQDHTVQPVVDVGGDDMLMFLASFAQDTAGTEIGMTVSVGGTVVSGNVIGRNAWLDLIAEQGNRQGGNGGTFLASLAEVYKRPTRDDDDDTPQRFGFLHFKDAAILMGPTMSPRGMLWRVRIEEVTAWTFSVISATS